MCNAIPILSPFFLYHPYIPHSLIRRIFLFSSLPSFFMHACIHKASGFIGGKGPRPLKKLSFCQTMVMLDSACMQSFMITHKQCFMLIVKYKVICILCSHYLRLVTIVYDYVMLP